MSAVAMLRGLAQHHTEEAQRFAAHGFRRQAVSHEEIAGTATLLVAQIEAEEASESDLLRVHYVDLIAPGRETMVTDLRAIGGGRDRMMQGERG